MPEKIITLEIPHQFEPVVQIWDSASELLIFLQKKHPEVTWQRTTLSDLIADYGEACLIDWFPEAEQFVKTGITDLILRGIRDSLEIIPTEEDDDELGWYLQHHLSDNHWAWCGLVSQAKDIQLPRHQQFQAQIALDEAIEEALS